MSESPELDDELKSQAVTLLLAEATTAIEINALTRVALRAGFMWRCFPCKRDHYLRTEKCGCGAGRPA
ncbi:hypothetical protein RVR_4423 [Actinacidiphila reveromycinica]|uniref:Uncharacterized protein n=1 Tax=Actinacidiphila reveromycinica TaxID=659352 RepID=A0A7U3UT70_9ACTN|nr:hypothetical protein [Streptomyces sp. SN-593]BBA98290.1 hypothetical protein RVR_4423 [Streptomyces sp. SN-593]